MEIHCSATMTAFLFTVYVYVSSVSAQFSYDLNHPQSAHKPPTFYLYRSQVNSMYYCGDWNATLSPKTAVVTNFPQLSPNAKIEENIFGLQQAMQLQEEEDSNLSVGVQDNYIYHKLTMDLSDIDWEDYALECIAPNVRSNDSLIYHISRNGALFAGEETVLQRVHYDYSLRKVTLELCNYNGTNSTHVNQVSTSQVEIPFDEFGVKKFSDYGISSLAFTTYQIVDFFSGAALPTNVQSDLVNFMAKANITSMDTIYFRQQSVTAATYQEDDAIPLEMFMFNGSNSERPYEIHLNVIDLSVVEAGDEIIADTYHDLCQSSYHYAGDYEAPLNEFEWGRLFGNASYANMICWFASVFLEHNFGPNTHLLIADDGRDAWECDVDNRMLVKHSGSWNSTYNNINASNSITHLMCLDYLHASGFDDDMDVTEEYCNSLSGTDAMIKCYARMIRYCEEGSALDEAIVRRDNLKALLDAVLLAVTQMSDDNVPGFVPITLQLLEFILRTQS